MTCNNQCKWGYNEARPPPSPTPVKPDGIEELNDLPACHSDENEPDIDDKILPLLTVPLANADAAAIKYLQSSEAVKSFGIFACPDGSTDVQLAKMQDKVEDWKLRS